MYLVHLSQRFGGFLFTIVYEYLDERIDFRSNVLMDIPFLVK